MTRETTRKELTFHAAAALQIVGQDGSEIVRSFEQMRIGSDSAADFLLGAGLSRGDRILVMLPNRAELWELMLASIKIGLVFCPATTPLSDAQVRECVERTAVRAVVTDISSAPKFEGLRVGIRIICDQDRPGWSTYRTEDFGDAFSSSGHCISAFELESVLVEHPDVIESAVVESPDPHRLFVPKAFVTLRAGARADDLTAKSIFDHTRERLAPHQRIRVIEFCGLPKTLSGKIRRVDLRKLEAQLRESGGRSAAEFFESDYPEYWHPDGSATS